MTKTHKRLMIFMLPFLVFVLMVLMFFNRLGQQSQVTINTTMNRPLPAFELPLLSNTQQTLTKDDLPKTPFLLNAWGSWCPTCKVEHPFLLQLKAQNVPIVGINYKDELTDALSYLQTYQDPFLYSLQDLDGRYGLDLGLTGAPETFVLDAHGVVYQHLTGELNEHNWQNQVKPCMDALADDAKDQTAKNKACQGL